MNDPITALHHRLTADKSAARGRAALPDNHTVRIAEKKFACAMKYPRSAGSINPANMNPTNPGRILPPRNFPRNRVAGAAALMLLLATGLQGGTWTSTDGSMTFEGELKSYMDVGEAMGKAMADLLQNQK